MVTERARIDSLEAGQAHLADAATSAGSVLVVTVSSTVPGWLTELVRAAMAVGATVVVEAKPPTALAGAALAGWEIGVGTAVLAAGVAGVEGIAPKRVARVREIGTSLAAALPEPEAAS